VDGLDPVWMLGVDRLPDCNSRDRGGILGIDEHLRREKSVAMKIDRIQPEDMSVRMWRLESWHAHALFSPGTCATFLRRS
jgi:hypothetical protein